MPIIFFMPDIRSQIAQSQLEHPLFQLINQSINQSITPTDSINGIFRHNGFFKVFTKQNEKRILTPPATFLEILFNLHVFGHLQFEICIPSWIFAPDKKSSFHTIKNNCRVCFNLNRNHSPRGWSKRAIRSLKNYNRHTTSYKGLRR